MSLPPPLPPPAPEPQRRRPDPSPPAGSFTEVERTGNQSVRDRRPSTALALIAAVTALTAIGLLAAALVRSPDGGNDDAVLEVTDAVAEAPPATIPPVSIETAPTKPVDSPTLNDADNSTRDSSSTADRELSPLAELLGPRYSTIPEELEPRPQPIGVSSGRIAIDRYPIRAVGLEDDGQLEVPDETEIGWYRYGATAGRPGATVLAAHVSWNNTTGPFFRLGTMEPGDLLTVELDDGSRREYEVTERTMYDKDELPRNRIWRNTGPESLVLITCGGDFNPEIRRYRQNIVVYAVPVAFTDPTFS